MADDEQLIKLPYGFVPDWFMAEQEESHDEVVAAAGERKAELAVRTTELVLRALVAYMKKNDLYFAGKRPPEPGPPKSVRCSVKNGVPWPSTYKGKGWCPTCGCLASLKQNGRLPVHWQGSEIEMRMALQDQEKK